MGSPGHDLHVDTIDEAKLRQTVKDTLADLNKRLVINYACKAIGQNGDGHISPIGAHDASARRVRQFFAIP